jgi:hypothetical protein
MSETYRLEFNEKQQMFHLDNYSHEENSFGWITITEHCTDLEFEIFEAYLDRDCIKEDQTLTEDHIINTFIDLQSFILKLMDYNISIVKNK